jgi:hypothetical protein
MWKWDKAGYLTFEQKTQTGSYNVTCFLSELLSVAVHCLYVLLSAVLSSSVWSVFLSGWSLEISQSSWHEVLNHVTPTRNIIHLPVWKSEEMASVWSCTFVLRVQQVVYFCLC